MSFLIKPVTFEQILPVWQTHLWPDRKSIIEPVSAIDINGLIDVNILNYINSAHFFAAINDQNEIAGVIAGHLTDTNQCRLRGLFVHEKYRGLGLSKQLIQTELTYAKSLACTEIWALIRTKNLGLFEKFGFKKKLETSKYEFGPHFIIDRTID